MRRLAVGLFLVLLSSVSVFGATHYVTSVACTNTYQVSTNTCGAASGINSYTSISAAYTASVAGDTLRFRTGTYTNTGQGPKANQIWEGCRAAACGTDEVVTMTRTTGASVIAQSCGGPGGWTLRYMNLVGASSGGRNAIGIDGGVGITLAHLDVSNWSSETCLTATCNDGGACGLGDYQHGVWVGGSGATDHDCPSSNITVDHVTVHDPNHTGCVTAGIAFGDTVGSVVSNSTIYNVDFDGIWFDTGPVVTGTVANQVTANVVRNIGRICYHAEARHHWELRNNLGIGCNEGIRLRPAATGGGNFMDGHLYYNNTIYSEVSPAFQAQNEMGTEQFDNATFRNNIFINNSATHPTIVMANPFATDAGNTWQGNLVWNRSTGIAVCWNNASGGFFNTCQAGATQYADSQAGLDSWASAQANVTPVVLNGNPLFVNPVNSASHDFRLCVGTNDPASPCGATPSPVINQGVDVGIAFNGAAPDLGAFESGTAAAPTFPQVGGSPATSATVTALTAHAPAMPASIGGTETVVLIMSFMSAPLPTATFTDAGWTIFSTVSATDRRMISAWRKGPPAGVTSTPVTTSVATRAAFYAVRFTGAIDPTVQPPQMSTGTTGASGNPDPDLLTPTGGSKDYLWFAVAGFGNNTCEEDITAYPAGYTNGVQVDSGGGNPAEGRLAVAYQPLTGSSQNPGAFSITPCTDASQMAATLAIHPIPAAPTCTAPVAGSPYPTSTHLCMAFNFATGLHAIDQAIGADNWPMTWADDGHQYTSWGDGGGFGGTDAPNERVSLGYGRIEGATAASYVGVNICGDLDMAPFLCTIDGKSYGMISINGGTLYSWVCPGTNTQCYDESRLYYSTNHAQSWTSTSVVFNNAQSLMIPTILNFGQDNAGARDTYMYSYFINTKSTAALSIQRPGEIVLVRVLATSHASIINPANYQWFAGLDGSNNPIWTTTVASRVPVFVDTARGVGWNVSVTHHPQSGRYILVTEHSDTVGGSIATFHSNIGVFDASEPWGNPTGDKWTTLWYQNGWGAPTIEAKAFYWTFAPKWFTPAGAFTMVFTGIDSLDDWNAVNGTLVSLEGEPDTVPPTAPTNFRVVSP